MFGWFKNKDKELEILTKQLIDINIKLDRVVEDNAKLKKQIETFNESCEEIKTQNRPIPHIVEIVYGLQTEVDIIKRFQNAKIERWEKNKKLGMVGKSRIYKRN